MAMTKSERLQAVHERAMTRFAKCYSSQREMRLQCVADRRFVYVPGAQWDGNLGEQFANRPRFEVNKVQMSVMRIFSEYRNNRVSVDFRAKDESANDDTADILDGLYRSDEQECNAQEAYDTAFDEGVSGGMGAWRLRCDYEDEEDEEDERLRIKIEPINDADSSVFFDIDAKRQDKRDATFCYVITSMTPDEYREKYEQDPTSFNMVERLTEWDWFQPDIVYIAEYYEIEENTKKINVYKLEATEEEIRLDEDDDEEAQTLLAQGYVLDRTKKVRHQKVHKYLIDGNQVLEDCGLIAGKYIPIVPFYGKRGYVENIERIQGHVRLTTDLMRLYNMLVSLLAEISIQSPIEKPILVPEQIQGHEWLWARDNIDRNPYLLLNPVQGTDGSMQPGGPVGYTKPPAIPPALVGLLQLCNIDLKELLGSAEQGDEVVANVSAKAIELIQSRLDMQTYIYMDNFAKAMRRCGEIWLCMAQDVYYEAGRKMKTVGSDGQVSEIELSRPVTGKSGAVEYENDIGSGKYDVIVDVGPSYTSRRDSTVRTLSSLLSFTQDQSERSAITGMILKNLDGEGLGDLKDWNRKRLVQAGIVKPSDAEAQELAAQAQSAQPSAEQQFLIAESEKSRAQAQKAQVDAIKAAAEADKTQAETAQILAQTNSERLENIMRILEGMRSNMPNQAQGVAPLEESGIQFPQGETAAP